MCPAAAIAPSTVSNGNKPCLSLEWTKSPPMPPTCTRTHYRQSETSTRSHTRRDVEQNRMANSWWKQWFYPLVERKCSEQQPTKRTARKAKSMWRVCEYSFGPLDRWRPHRVDRHGSTWPCGGEKRRECCRVASRWRPLWMWPQRRASMQMNAAGHRQFWNQWRECSWVATMERKCPRRKRMRWSGICIETNYRWLARHLSHASTTLATENREECLLSLPRCRAAGPMM